MAVQVQQIERKIGELLRFVTLSSVGAGAIGMTALVLLYPRTPIARLVGSGSAEKAPM